MIAPAASRPPRQVQTVVLITVIRSASVFADTSPPSNAARAARVLVAVLLLALCWGLWRGAPVARWLAIIWAAIGEAATVMGSSRPGYPGPLDVGLPLLIIALLLLPKSARRWFADPVRGSASTTPRASTIHEGQSRTVEPTNDGH
jgi:hypothetical protein